MAFIQTNNSNGVSDFCFFLNKNIQFSELHLALVVQVVDLFPCVKASLAKEI